MWIAVDHQFSKNNKLIVILFIIMTFAMNFTENQGRSYTLKFKAKIHHLDLQCDLASGTAKLCLPLFLEVFSIWANEICHFHLITRLESKTT